MRDIVRERLGELRRLCEKHHARRLELFGSAAHGDVALESNDLDFLVEFEDLSPASHAASYFGLLADLEDLFRLPIDLIEIQAIHNPYFLQEVERTRMLLYAA